MFMCAGKAKIKLSVCVTYVYQKRFMQYLQHFQTKIKISTLSKCFTMFLKKDEIVTCKNGSTGFVFLSWYILILSKFSLFEICWTSKNSEQPWYLKIGLFDT